MPIVPYKLDPGFNEAPTFPPDIPQPERRGGGFLQFGENWNNIVEDVQNLPNVIGSAFQMENDVVNAIQLLGAPNLPPDKNFNLEANLKAAELWDEYRWSFIGVDNATEFLYKTRKIQNELNARKILQAAGPDGVVASFVAGAASPTILLPLVGPGLKGMKAIATGLAWGMVGGVAQEVPLQLNQELRTLQDSVSSIAMSTIVGGIFGGAQAFLNRGLEATSEGIYSTRGVKSISPSEERVLIERRMKEIDEAPAGSPVELTIERKRLEGRLNELDAKEAEIASAKARDQEIAGSAIGKAESAGAAALDLDAGGLKGMLGIGERLTKIAGPVTAVLGQKVSAQGRRMMAQLSTAGLRLEKNLVLDSEGNIIGSIPSNSGGTVESLINSRRGDLLGLIDRTYEKYADYWFGGSGASPGKFRASRAYAAGLLPKGAGAKLNRRQFMEEVGTAMRNGDQHQIPEVQAAAEDFRGFYDGLLKEAQDLGIIPEEIRKVAPDLSFLNRVYDTDAIARNPQKFMNLLRDHFENQLSQDLERIHTAWAKADERDAQMLSDFELPLDQIESLRNQFTKELKALESIEDDDVGPVEDLINAIRSDMRELTRKRKALEKELETAARPRQKEIEAELDGLKTQRQTYRDGIEQLQQAAGPDLEARQLRRRYLKSRLRNFNRSRYMVEERARKKFDKIDQLEEQNVEALHRVVMTGKRALDAMEKQGDDFEKLLGQMQTEVNKAGSATEKLNNQLDELQTQLAKENERQNANPTGKAVSAPKAPPTLDPKVIEAEAFARTQNLREEIAGSMNTLAHAKLPKSLAKLRDQIVKNDEPSFQGFLDFADAWEVYAGNTKVPDELAKAVGDVTDFFQGVITKEAAAIRKSAQKDFNDIVEYYRKADPVSTPLEDWLAAAKKETRSHVDGAVNNLYRYPIERQAMELVLHERRMGEVANAQKSTEVDAPSEAKILAKIFKVEEQAAARRAELAEAWNNLADLQNVNWTERGLADARAAVQDALDASLRQFNDLISRRAKRQASLEKQAEKFDKGAWEIKRAEIAERRRLRTEEVRERVHNLGGDDYDMATGRADFSERAKEVAQIAHDRITGANVRLAGFDAMRDKRGTELARTLSIDSNVLAREGFLINDAEHLAHVYNQTLVPDIEITRRFGAFSPDGERNLEFQALNEEKTALLERTEAEFWRTHERTPENEAKLQKQNLAIDKEYKLIRENLDATIRRLRGDWGIPKNPDGYIARGVQIVLSAQALRFLGTVGISSIPDVAKPIARYGLLRTLREGWVPMIANWNAVKLTAREARRAYVAVESATAQRAHQVADLMYFARSRSKFEAGLAWTTSKMGIVAGFAPWTDAMKTISTMTLNSKIMDDLELALHGTGNSAARKEAVEFMASLGWSDDMQRRIWDQMQDGGAEKIGGTWVPQTANWTDAEAVRAYRAAVNQEASASILTPGVELNKIANSSLTGRLLFNLKSFALASTSKTLMAGLQQRDLAVLNGILSSLALGALSFYLRSIVTGGAAEARMRKSIEDGNWELWVDEAFDASGLLGSLQIAAQVGQDIPYLRNVSSIGNVARTVQGKGAQMSSRTAAAGLVEDVAGPSADLAFTMAQIMTGLDKPDRAQVHRVRQLLPLQNLFYLRRLFDQMENSISDQFNLSGQPR